MQQLYGYSVTYRIALGPHQGRKIFTLQTLPPLAESKGLGQAAKLAGFFPHAGVVAEPHCRDKLERLCQEEGRLKLPPTAGRKRGHKKGIGP